MHLLLSLLAFGTLCALATPAAYQSINLDGSQATLHQFSSYGDPTADGPSKSPGVSKVLKKMQKRGVFTAIVMHAAKTSIRVPEQGLMIDTPTNFAKTSAKPDDNFVFTNGGFFLMSTGSRGGYSIGPSISTSNQRYLEVDNVYMNDYRELRGDDGTFLWSGPSLREPIDLEEPRFQYWVKDTKKPSRYTMIPGGLPHANQPNERLAFVRTRQAKVVFAYTSRRRNGLNINQLRTLIDVFLQTYLNGTTVANTELAVNLDGGGSLFVGYHSKGKTYRIVSGEARETGEAVPLGLRDPAGLEYRAVANFVRHDLTPGTGSRGSSKRPAPDQSEGPPNKKPKTGGPEPKPGSPSSGGQPSGFPAPGPTATGGSDETPSPPPSGVPPPKPPAPRPTTGGSGKTPAPQKGGAPSPPARKPTEGGARVRRGGPSARRSNTAGEANWEEKLRHERRR